MRHFVLLFAAVGFMAFVSLAPAENTTPTAAPAADKVAATVNGMPILVADVDKQFVHPASDNSTEKIGEARRYILNVLIDRELIIQSFRKSGNKIPTDYIDKRIRDIVKDEYGNDSAAFAQTLKERGVTLEKYRAEIEENAIVGYERSRHFSRPAATGQNDTDKKAEEARLQQEWFEWLAMLRKEATIQVFQFN
jgi:hypothetical protein